MKGFFEHDYLKYKKSHLKNLVALARSDDQLHESEIAFLYKIGTKYGLKKKQIANIIEDQENIVAELPRSHDVRMDQLHDLVGMMLADGSVEMAELDFCDEMAEKMGFKSAIIHHLVEFVKSGRKDTDEWEAFKQKALEDMLLNDTL